MPSAALPWTDHLEDSLKRAAGELGFDACGIARAQPVDSVVRQRYRQWLDDGLNGTMAWANRYADVRDDPRLLLPDAQSLVMLAINYLPPTLLPPDVPQFARYAYGQDYHTVVRRRLHTLAARLTEATGARCRCLVDTAPLRERYWAAMAGIGFVGRNHQLIIPQRGSFFFLGAIVTTAALRPDTPPQPLRVAEAGALCGTCNRCVEACPVGALTSGKPLDARRCLSCLTIEHRGALPTWLTPRQLGNRVYGCDECQLACPHNDNARPTTIAEFVPSADFLRLSRADLLTLTDQRFLHLFGSSAVRRAGAENLRRNAALAATASSDSSANP